MESSTDDNNISNPELKFEEAIDKLEQIVSDMEHNEVDLNSMIENYKEGMSLLKFCKKSIDLAELKVSEISTENSEQPTFCPLQKQKSTGNYCNKLILHKT